MDKKKRKEIEELVLSTMSLLDKSKLNYKKYKELFASMKDDKFEKWLKAFLKNKEQNFFLEVVPLKNEPTLNDIEKAAKNLKIPLEEFVYMKHLDNNGRIIRTKYKVPVGYLYIKKMQHFLEKKNSLSTSISSRSQKFNQLTGKDKVARVTQPEVYSLLAIGAEVTLKEIMGPRADNETMKQQMYKKINMEGNVNLNDLKDDNNEKQTLNTVDTYLLGLGLKTDLLTDGLTLQATMSESNNDDYSEIYKAYLSLLEYQPIMEEEIDEEDEFKFEAEDFEYISESSQITRLINPNSDDSVYLFNFDRTICFSDPTKEWEDDKVHDGKENTTITSLMKSLHDIFEFKDIRIFTARKSVSEEAIRIFVKGSLIHNDIEIVCLGSFEKEAKGNYINENFKGKNVFFYDDRVDYLLHAKNKVRNNKDINLRTFNVLGNTIKEI